MQYVFAESKMEVCVFIKEGERERFFVKKESWCACDKGGKKKWAGKIGKNTNGMLRHSLGGVVILISLVHFIATALDLMPCLQARGTRNCDKGIKFKKKARKCC